MSLVVNTNISSLTAQRSLASSDQALETAMERLSSGRKINSASDDAAGLAIVERMTAQINGLNMAIKNANDGIAMTQSIEGALVEVTDMLQRLRELSVQAANDTNTSTDRKYIQEEVNLLIAELTRVSANTRYNNQLILDGNYTNKRLQVGTEGGENISVSIDSVAANKLGSYTYDTIGIAAIAGDTADTVPDSTVVNQDALKVMGKGETATLDVDAADSAKDVAALINGKTGTTGVSASAKTYAELVFTSTVATYNLQINGKAVGAFSASTGNASDAVSKINAVSGTTGVTAALSQTVTNSVVLYDSTGADIQLENDSTDGNADFTVFALKHDGSSRIGSAASITDPSASDVEAARIVGNIQLTSADTFSVVDGTSLHFASDSASQSVVSNISLVTQSGADSAIKVIDGAIEKVASMRANLGAVQNRLEHTVSNLMNVSENTADARSRINDADFSLESANLAKAQVLQQVGAAMLTQANARPQLVLQLLQ